MTTAPHRIEFTEEHLDTWGAPSATFHCDAPKDATCRTWCIEGCEETCPGPDTHKWADIGKCYEIEWLSLGDYDDYYTGSAPHGHVSGHIRTEWQGDYYTWEYAA